MEFLNNPYVQFLILVVCLVVYIWFFVFRVSSKKNHVLKEKLKENPVIIDVRSPSEFKEDHYEGAINIPNDKLYAGIVEKVKDKNKAIIVYCASGMRSAQAYSLLKESGYTNITNAGALSKFRKLTH